MRKLNLGQELSKSEQKKILGGGATCTTSWGGTATTYSPYVNCSNAAGYCAGVYGGTVVSCW
ncbi:hypothetical protein GTQ34_13875 [Muricauda sp. JGD-17]|uniref:Uncharacterized protein n=1 Tax=Flagellimonas ochracea TaxID=2696472 RepID=A0A964WYN7_9FLAO|nr:hypothetical protein [Allomuricauda ochracea]NAY93008.1 hypothetical protein [Allomuricauda ochracea]